MDKGTASALTPAGHDMRLLIHLGHTKQYTLIAEAASRVHVQVYPKIAMCRHCVQVRCIAAVLLMVGRGQEQPEVEQSLLDVDSVICKPQTILYGS